uniref:Uncharacterized protein n=1 Tax=Sphaerodactylus townsendi TaxID=933632 RepID=A0ACB8GC88_9SAUR
MNALPELSKRAWERESTTIPRWQEDYLSGRNTIELIDLGAHWVNLGSSGLMAWAMLKCPMVKIKEGDLEIEHWDLLYIGWDQKAPGQPSIPMSRALSRKPAAKKKGSKCNPSDGEGMMLGPIDSEEKTSTEDNSES